MHENALTYSVLFSSWYAYSTLTLGTILFNCLLGQIVLYFSEIKTVMLQVSK